MKTRILIRCSYKLIPLPVSLLGEISDLKKKIFPHGFVNRSNLNYSGGIPDQNFFNSYEDYLLFKKDNSYFNLKEISVEYCVRDLLIVANVLENIFPILKLYYGGLSVLRHSFSFSSISYRIFSKKYDRMRITFMRTPAAVTEYIRNAYYGGRCEVFGNPKNGEIIHYFDYKGMYARCMMEKYPYGSPILKKNNLDVSQIGFHTIKFKCDDYLPFLPVKGDRLLFPNGTIIGTY